MYLMKKVTAQEHLENSLDKIFRIFKGSHGEIRPHFILTGPSGTGKTYTIERLCEENDIAFVEINAAQLTKEGTAGNSLSKAMVPLAAHQGNPTVCFVDEFDKLFLSGNHNEVAHDVTLGVQNEFLKVLESGEAAIAGEFGKFPKINISNVLFVFAGAFNGQQNISMDDLREIGLKTEFLGRVGLLYETRPITLEMLFGILENSPLLSDYFDLFDTSEDDQEDTLVHLREAIRKDFENNTIGARMITAMIHKYFIQDGVLDIEVVKNPTPKKKLKFSKS